ncbi:MAG: ATP-binding protein [Oligoflexia bacterium]|nr:ATP-binding protein [Oligoflexia bacterium]
MIPKKFEDIDEKAVQSLIENSQPENKTLDYKKEIPLGTDDDKKEFLADIVSFSNTSGGDLVIGLAEKRDKEGKKTGQPEFFGLPEDLNEDFEIQRLSNVITSGIQPKVTQFKIRFIKWSNGKKVGIIRIDQSLSSPHMVTYKMRPAFFVRNSVGKQPLDVHEIQNAFLGNEHLTEKIRNFRTERIGKILANETPTRLSNSRCILLQLYPIKAVMNSIQLDIKKIENRTTPIQAMHTSSYNNRYNLEGWLSYSSGTESHSYLQVFRNGPIETVESSLLNEHEKIGYAIPYITVEGELIKSLDSFFKLL